MSGFNNIDYRIRTITQLKNTMQWPSYIHPNSIVEPTVTIGIGCIVYPMSTLLHRAAIDDFSAVCTNAHISHGTILGKNVVVCPGVIIGGSTTVGDNVFFGQKTSVRDKILICSNTRFAMSSVVTKSIGIPGVYVGNRKSNITL
jgi:UDP-3-O-[3-hydroxymyristoyl] glucosamine N-acyltransferase